MDKKKQKKMKLWMNKGELVISLFIYSTNLMTFSHISFYDIRYISTLRNISTFRHPATGYRLREARMSRQASFIVARRHGFGGGKRSETLDFVQLGRVYLQSFGSNWQAMQMQHL